MTQTDIKHRTSKVGIAPYLWDASVGRVKFLVQLPKPKDPADYDKMSWGLARGTVGYRKSPDADFADLRDENGKDILDPKMLSAIALDQIQDHAQAATKEAQEELGVDLEPFFKAGLVQDHGAITYHSKSAGRDGQPKGSYDIHFYSVQLSGDADIDRSELKDTDGLAWKTIAELKEMTKTMPAREQFKPEYIEVLEQIAKQINPPHPARGATQRG